MINIGIRKIKKKMIKKRKRIRKKNHLIVILRLLLMMIKRKKAGWDVPECIFLCFRFILSVSYPFLNGKNERLKLFLCIFHGHCVIFSIPSGT